jgi:glycerol-3-phosphate acyltransferase PlsX
MSRPVTLSLDVMGGDRGPEVVVPGAELALVRCPDLRYLLFGDEAAVRPLVEARPRLAAASEIRHCDVAVRMDDKPSQALRYGRWRSSMWRAIEAAKTGEADAAISAGNTGALMAMAKFCLKTMSDVERPAIAAIWPTLRGDSIVLDMGATIGADAEQLVDFAILGGAMARAVLGLDRPSVGLLNIGVEEVKGLDAIREAGQLLREADLPHLAYHGFVEGDDVGQGTVDVVVTEGFSGNIALKTAEGTARQIAAYLKASIDRSLLSRIGYLLARPAFERLKEKMDPRKSNGGVFLGLNGIVVKSHGGTDAEGFASAVELGHDMVRNDLRTKIAHDLAAFRQSRARLERAAVLGAAS